MPNPGLWLGRPLADEEDAGEAEQRAAALEFGHALPRHEAEARAYEEYQKDRRLQAAAHHLAGIRASQGAGDMDSARRHGLLYQLHLNALGMDPNTSPPPEVLAKLNAPEKKSLYRFKSHPADVFALPAEDVKKSIEDRDLEELSKSRETCDYTAKTTKERCKNPRSRKVAGRSLCHHHADLAAKEDHRQHKAAPKAPEQEVLADLGKSVQDQLRAIYAGAKAILDLKKD